MADKPIGRQISECKNIQDFSFVLAKAYGVALPAPQIISVALSAAQEARIKEIEDKLEKLNEYVRFYHG